MVVPSWLRLFLPGPRLEPPFFLGLALSLPAPAICAQPDVLAVLAAYPIFGINTQNIRLFSRLLRLILMKRFSFWHIYLIKLLFNLSFRVGFGADEQYHPRQAEAGGEENEIHPELGIPGC